MSCGAFFMRSICRSAFGRVCAQPGCSSRRRHILNVRLLLCLLVRSDEMVVYTMILKRLFFKQRFCTFDFTNGTSQLAVNAVIVCRCAAKRQHFNPEACVSRWQQLPTTKCEPIRMPNRRC